MMNSTGDDDGAIPNEAVTTGEHHAREVVCVLSCDAAADNTRTAERAGVALSLPTELTPETGEDVFDGLITEDRCTSQQATASNNPPTTIREESLPPEFNELMCSAPPTGPPPAQAFSQLSLVSPVSQFCYPRPDSVRDSLPGSHQYSSPEGHVRTYYHQIERSAPEPVVGLQLQYPRFSDDRVRIYTPTPPDIRCPLCPRDNIISEARDEKAQIKKLINHVQQCHKKKCTVSCLGCGRISSKNRKCPCRSLNNVLIHPGARWVDDEVVPSQPSVRTEEWRISEPLVNAARDQEERWLFPVPSPKIVVCPECHTLVSSGKTSNVRRHYYKQHVKSCHAADITLACNGCQMLINDLGEHRIKCEALKRCVSPGGDSNLLPVSCLEPGCKQRFAAAKLANKHHPLHRRWDAKSRAEAAGRLKARTARAQRSLDCEAFAEREKDVTAEVRGRGRVLNDVRERTKSPISPPNFTNKPTPGLLRPHPNYSSQFSRHSEALPGTATYETRTPNICDEPMDGSGGCILPASPPSQRNRLLTSSPSPPSPPSPTEAEESWRHPTQLTTAARNACAPSASLLSPHPLSPQQRSPMEAEPDRTDTTFDSAGEQAVNAGAPSISLPPLPTCVTEPDRSAVNDERRSRTTPAAVSEDPTTAHDTTSSHQQASRRRQRGQRGRRVRPTTTGTWSGNLHALHDALVRLAGQSPCHEGRNELQRLYLELVSELQAIAKLPEERPYDPTRRLIGNKEIDGPTLKRLYTRHPRRAIRLICGNESEYCEIPRDEIEEYFKQSLSPPLQEEEQIFPQRERPEIEDSPFTNVEVCKRLSRAENTAPGNDRLTYDHLRTIDPEAHALTALFNAVRTTGHIPEEWRLSRTVLIGKGGDKDDMKNWRPICLMSTICKLYVGVWASRFTTWAEAHDVFSPAQKGFRPFDGVLEHNYIMETTILNARRRRNSLCLALLDLTNAFGSVTHQTLLAAAEAAGVGRRFLGVVEDIYTDCKTEVITASGKTAPLNVRRGVRQGCPLSSNLFNLVVDNTLREIQDSCPDKTCVLAYADDLALFADTPEELQQRIDKITQSLAKLHITINPRKCRTLHFDDSIILPSTFRAGETPMPHMEYAESHKYLGKPVGFHVIPPWETVNKAHEMAQRIAAAPLHPWQQLNAFKKFLFPSLTFPLRMHCFTKTQLHALDDALRPLIKKILRLPESATNHYIYGSREAGAMGITELGKETDFWAIDVAFKLMSSKDRHVREIALLSLKTEAASCQQTTTDEASPAAYLSGEPIARQQPTTCFWMRARKASARVGVKWTFDGDSPVIALPHASPETPPIGAVNQEAEQNNSQPEALPVNDAPPLLVVAKQRYTIMRRLKEWNKRCHDAAWRALPNQGRTARCLVECDVVSHRAVDHGKGLDWPTWRFLHCARLNVAGGLRHRPYPGRDSEESACRYNCTATDGTPRAETLAHVLCMCPSHSALWQLRHNKVVNALKTAAIKTGHTVLAENRSVAGCRPDLIIRRNLKVTVFEVSVPFANYPAKLGEVRNHKTNKYQHLVAHFTSYGNREVVIAPIIVGALGEWPKENWTHLQDVTPDARQRRLLAEGAVTDVLQGSRSIFFRHTRREDLMAPEYRRGD